MLPHSSGRNGENSFSLVLIVGFVMLALLSIAGTSSRSLAPHSLLMMVEAATTTTTSTTSLNTELANDEENRSSSSLSSSSSDSTSNARQWYLRRRQFYLDTTFALEQKQLDILGGAFWAQRTTGHLPFWFDFELFKAAYGKAYKTPKEESRRHWTYLKTCLRLLKQRATNMLMSSSNGSGSANGRLLIDRDADQFYEESIPYLARQRLDGATGGQEEPTAEGDTAGEISFSVQFDGTTDDDDENDENEKDKNEDQEQRKGSPKENNNNNNNIENNNNNHENENKVPAAPVRRAIRLVRDQLAKVETRSQLEWYFTAFDENVDSIFASAKLPF